MKRRILTVLTMLTLFSPMWTRAAVTDAILTNCAEVSSLVLAATGESAVFDLTATVLLPPLPQRRLIGICDDSGGALVDLPPAFTNFTCQPGDTIRIRGFVNQLHLHFSAARSHDVTVLSRGLRPTATNTIATAIHKGRLDYRLVRLEGVLADAFRDEIDPYVMFFILDDGHGTCYASAPVDNADEPALQALIGRKVAIQGLCVPCNEFNRKLLGHTIFLTDCKSITPVSSTRSDTFNAAEIPTRTQLSPRRHRLSRPAEDIRACHRSLAR